MFTSTLATALTIWKIRKANIFFYYLSSIIIKHIKVMQKIGHSLRMELHSVRKQISTTMHSEVIFKEELYLKTPLIFNIFYLPSFL